MLWVINTLVKIDCPMAPQFVEIRFHVEKNRPFDCFTFSSTKAHFMFILTQMDEL